MLLDESNTAVLRSVVDHRGTGIWIFEDFQGRKALLEMLLAIPVQDDDVDQRYVRELCGIASHCLLIPRGISFSILVTVAECANDYSAEFTD